MIDAIFSAISESVEGFMDVVSDGLAKVTDIIYVAPTGTETTGHLTAFGTLLLVAAGVGIGYWLFRLIKGLVRAA